MYKTIVLTLDNSPADRPIIEHILQLASTLHSSVTLLHVANSPAVQFHQEDAEDEEVKNDRAYLNQVQAEFAAASIPASVHLAFGDPVNEIIKYIETNPADLLAMGTHGHKLIADFLLGSTASRVQHNISTPVLLLRAK